MACDSVQDGLQVLNVEREGPAFRNGLKPDDVIIEIDGEEIAVSITA